MYRVVLEMPNAYQNDSVSELAIDFPANSFEAYLLRIVAT